MSCKDYNPPQNHLKCIIHVKDDSYINNCFYHGVHLLNDPPLRHKDRPSHIVESPFYWRRFFIEKNNNNVKEFEKNNPGYFVILWKPYKDSFKIFYRNKSFQYDSTIFHFVYHKEHYSAITMLEAFYKFVFKSKKKVYPCLFCTTPFYNEDEFQAHHCI